MRILFISAIAIAMATLTACSVTGATGTSGSSPDTGTSTEVAHAAAVQHRVTATWASARTLVWMETGAKPGRGTARTLHVPAKLLGKRVKLCWVVTGRLASVRTGPRAGHEAMARHGRNVATGLHSLSGRGCRSSVRLGSYLQIVPTGNWRLRLTAPRTAVRHHTSRPVPTPTPTPTITHTRVALVPTHTRAPTPRPTPTPTSCYPLTNGGNCYEPGEFCRQSDAGMTGVAGNGERIECRDNNGLRWEPA